MGVRRFKTALGSQVKNYGTGSSRILVLPIMDGGTKTTTGSYAVHSFASAGTFSLNLTGGYVTCEYLVVAGGGGGGKHTGGGGAGYYGGASGESGGGARTGGAGGSGYVNAALMTGSTIQGYGSSANRGTAGAAGSNGKVMIYK